MNYYPVFLMVKLASLIMNYYLFLMMIFFSGKRFINEGAALFNELFLNAEAGTLYLLLLDNLFDVLFKFILL